MVKSALATVFTSDKLCACVRDSFAVRYNISLYVTLVANAAGTQYTCAGAAVPVTGVAGCPADAAYALMFSSGAVHPGANDMYVNPRLSQVNVV